MNNIFSIVTLAILIAFSTSLEAQTSKQLQPAVPTNKAMTGSVNNKNARTLNKSNHYTQANFIEEAENEELELKYISGYKVNFLSNTMPEPEMPIATMDVYTGKNEKIAKLRFFTNDSEEIAEQVFFEEDIMNLNYAIDLMPNIMEFFRYSPKTIIVYNPETKEAYLSSAVSPTRGR